MNREEKAAVIDQVAEEIGGAEAIFAVDYRGITVAQIADLRTKLRDTDTKLQVTKNSLAELAADKANSAELKPFLAGPTALAFVKGDPAAAAKTLADARRLYGGGPLEAKGGLLGGKPLSGADVDALAKLPTRQVLYGQLVGVVAAPLTGLARGLNALIGGLAIQLGAIAEQGLVGGTAPAAPTDAAAGPEAPAAEAAAEAAAAEAPAAEAPAAEASPEEATSTEAASDDATPTDA
jgi:large subunit ribosomal protein L10